MISREDVALALETAYGDSYSPEGRAQHERAAAAILALIQSTSEVPVQRDERAEKLGEQLDAMVAEVNTSNRTIVRLEERAQKAEGERDTWKDCIAEEMAENIKLFNLLGVMPEIEAGRAGTDAVVEAVRRLKADLATTQAALTEIERPPQWEKDIVLTEEAANNNVSSFMLPQPVPATPIPPDPRDAVVEAAEFLVMLPAGAPSEEATERYEALVRAVHALRATEGRG